MAGGNQIRLRVAGNRLKAARQSFCGSTGRDSAARGPALALVLCLAQRMHKSCERFKDILTMLLWELRNFN